MIRLFLAACILSWAAALSPSALRAEECVDGVHAMAPWTRALVGNAIQWPLIAAKLGFAMNQTAENGAVIVYPPTYGRHINSVYGHVALLVDIKPDAAGRILVKDSNGICGGDRRQCRARMPDWKRVFVIHPKR